MTENKLFRSKEAAEHIGLAENTLAKMRVKGDGPRFAKLGRVVVYRVADLDAWVSARLRASTSEATAPAASGVA